MEKIDNTIIIGDIMAMNRRDAFKLAGVTAITVALPKMATASEKVEVANKASGRSVLIIGGGFGGLALAKAVKKQDKKAEVTVIEKNTVFHGLPFFQYIAGRS